MKTRSQDLPAERKDLKMGFGINRMSLEPGLAKPANAALMRHDASLHISGRFNVHPILDSFFLFNASLAVQNKMPQSSRGTEALEIKGTSSWPRHLSRSSADSGRLRPNLNNRRVSLYVEELSVSHSIQRQE